MQCFGIFAGQYKEVHQGATQGAANRQVENLVSSPKKTEEEFRTKMVLLNDVEE